MTFAQTVTLGALAGATIFLGLPLARLGTLSARTRVALAMFAVGILAFLFVDVFEHAFGITEHAVEQWKTGHAGFGPAVWRVLLLAAGLSLGLAGLATGEARLQRRRRETLPPMMGGATHELSSGQLQAAALVDAAARSRALWTGMTIAAAIGLHNFAEGLAIGVSSRAGQMSLATVLIVGFALHNATEGFGIVGPLGNVRPTWRWLAIAGLVGGGPTFLGTLVGWRVTSEPLELLFYALAGGAILYVIGEIWSAMRRHGHRELGLWMLVAGFVIGLVTDMVVVYGGG
ncbi:MAG: zinc transporter, family [Gaiellales bacterium]|nr:zinc transporter, family [Gaiellales bacterium]